MDLHRSIGEEHAFEAAFLWTRRDRAVVDPIYDRADVAALDERIEAHLDGLRFAEALGVECAAALVSDEPGPGEAFVATLVATERLDLKAIAGVLDLAGEDPDAARGIVSALGWAPSERFDWLLPGFLSERCPPALQWIGIGACAIRRSSPPGEAIERALRSSSARLRARALRAVAELGLVALAPLLRASLQDDDEDCRFWAAWSAVLLGDMRPLDDLWAFAIRGGVHAERAAAVAARRLDAQRVLGDVRALVQAEAGVRPAFAAAAALGEPAVLPWLIERMADPAMARRAGLAWSMITGVDLGSAELEAEAPAGLSVGPTDEADDEDVEEDPDDGLPFANLDALRAWWQGAQARFEPGKRYLLGKPVADGAWLEEVLERGHQVARAAAAVELVISGRRKALPEVRAVAWR